MTNLKICKKMQNHMRSRGDVGVYFTINPSEMRLRRKYIFNVKE